jgi:hypothetical protein
MAVFWVVAPCSLVEVSDISEVLAASIIRAIALTRRSENLKSHLLTKRFLDILIFTIFQ